MKALRRARGRDDDSVLAELLEETGLTAEDGTLYMKLLREGQLPISESEKASRLLEKGMAIVSGDGKRVIPVHPRLGIASQYRTWREQMVREINERRMRVDKLILELIPLYEAAMEKKRSEGGG